jgi:hypothetical protein
MHCAFAGGRSELEALASHLGGRPRECRATPNGPSATTDELAGSLREFEGRQRTLARRRCESRERLGELAGRTLGFALRLSMTEEVGALLSKGRLTNARVCIRSEWSRATNTGSGSARLERRCARTDRGLQRARVGDRRGSGRLCECREPLCERIERLRERRLRLFEFEAPTRERFGSAVRARRAADRALRSDLFEFWSDLRTSRSTARKTIADVRMPWLNIGTRHRRCRSASG